MKLNIRAIRFILTSLFVLGGAGCAFSLASATSDHVPPVTVQLRSPWNTPPLLVELLESAYKEEASSFFTLIDRLSVVFQSPSEGQKLYDMTDERLVRIVQRALDDEGLLSSPGQRQSWNASLALRAELPRIAASWQLYNTSGIHQRMERQRENDGGGCVESWVDLGEEVACSVDELRKVLHSTSSRRIDPPISALDHVFPSTANTNSTAVLYADAYTNNFWDLHTTLRDNADKVQYVLRWKPSHRLGEEFLTGFDAYLDLKKVDYLVIDDRKLVDTNAQRLNSQAMTAETSLDMSDVKDRAWLNAELKATSDDLQTSMGALSEEEIRGLGVTAAYAIVQSSEPLRALKQLSQDFPSHVVALARRSWRPDGAFVKAIASMQEVSVEAGGEDVWMNGRALSGKEFQSFGLLSAMRDERKLMNDFLSLGLNTKEVYALLTSSNVSKAYMHDESAPPPFFDASDRIESREDERLPGAIVYWNDLEAIDDPRYAHWPIELRSLLRPLYPGSFPMIRRNIFNVILAMDPSRTDTIRLLSDTVQMATNKVALRWGFVPIGLNDEQSPSTSLARMLWLAVDQLGTSMTAKWLRRVAAAMQNDQYVDVERAGQLLDKMLHTTTSERQELLEQGKAKADARLDRARRWTKRLRADEHETGSAFINGQHMPFHPQLFQSLHQFIAVQMQILAPAIYFGQIDDQITDMSTYFYDQQATYTARSDLLFPSDEGSIKTSALALAGPLAPLVHALGGEESVESDIAIWILGDTTNEKGRKLVNDIKLVKEKRHVQSFIVSLDSPLRQLVDVVPNDAYALLINGKLIYGFEPELFDEADYAALIEQERRKVATVRQQLSSSKLDSSRIITASSIVNTAYYVDASKQGLLTTASSARSTSIDHLFDSATSFTVGDPDTATLRFSVLLDPIGKSVQKWSGIMEMLSQQSDVFLHVTLNPSLNVTEMPLKRFYRSSTPFQLHFDESGNRTSKGASFREMPQDAVLTMGLDAPPTWLTMPVDAIYDLDNIRLRDAVAPTVRAVYDLKYILIEGHVRDESSKVPPRGLQLVLETLDGSQTLDTIVMANLAYFQFRASPGVYRLRIREGRSAELYDMISVGNVGWDSPTIEVTGDAIILDAFHGLTIFPRMLRKKGKERERLVEDEEASASTSASSALRRKDLTTAQVDDETSSGTLERFSHYAQKFLSAINNFTLDKGRSFKAQRSSHADINVFTVASGHLYERMTYIMILSTLKNTNHTVKFWFIENFLSPSFKSFIPFLANEYNFEYELVTYAWPHWLRTQSEKQREIWGMKVLFLDVLFPLNLSKVIFVDADQIVRADLIELIETDLHGAPYGFAPMGNDSYDMDNFRFWESGYWEKFLRGKPYPISALFVVDLNRFRLVAAGDKLRGHYQALSADPGSLSNLDQDLVASMIHNVPIFSLRREWLWCETWCSWEWYHEAKSIDLCSNPKTLEPKLERARRQIPEWTILDDEVAELARRLEEEGKLGANVVASSEKKKEYDLIVDNDNVQVEKAGETEDAPASSTSSHDEL